jgi:hypothetical protein
VTARDADIPANTLVFSLVNGPVGAILEPQTGLFTWTPPSSEVGRANTVRVRVVDNGQPNLAATNEFTIYVRDPLRILSAERVAGNLSLTWSAIQGKQYRVQYKNTLAEPRWTDLSGDITAAGTTASKTDETIGDARQRFYRVIQIPGG